MKFSYLTVASLLMTACATSTALEPSPPSSSSRALRGSSKQRAAEDGKQGGEPRSLQDIQIGLVPDATLTEFKVEEGLKSDYDPFLQVIDGESFYAHGKEYSLQNLTPYEVEKPGMTVLIDDVEISNTEQLQLVSYIGEDTETGDTYLVVNDLDGTVNGISFHSNVDGKVTLIEKVNEEGVYATIVPDAYDDTTASDNNANIESIIPDVDVTDDFRRNLDQVVKDATTTQEGRQPRQLSGFIDHCNGSYRNIDVAIAFDFTFCNRFGGIGNDYGKAVHEVKRIVAWASIQYFQPLCINLEISHIEGYCKRQTDRYVSHLICFERYVDNFFLKTPIPLQWMDVSTGF